MTGTINDIMTGTNLTNKKIKIVIVDIAYW